MFRKSFLTSLAALSLWLAGPSFAPAQSMKPAGDGTTIQDPSFTQPTLLKDVGMDQKLGTQISGDLVFKDDFGQPVRLSDYYKKGKPILFTLVFYQCPRTCTTVLTEMTKALMSMQSLNPGKDFEVVVLSFDPREGPDLAAKKKIEYLKMYRRPNTEAGWHFLTGDEASIKKLTSDIGFRYAWDAKSQQFIHAGGLMVLTPDGKVSKYFYKTEYVPRDINFALMDAANSRIGTPVDALIRYCFEYDPHTGRYSFVILTVVQVLGGVTVLGIGLFVVRSVRREKYRKLTPADAAAMREAAPLGTPSNSSTMQSNAEPGLGVPSSAEANDNGKDHG